MPRLEFTITLLDIECRHDAFADRGFYSPVNVMIGVAENTRAYPHHTQVDVSLAVQVCNFGPSPAGGIGRPLL
ncbi:MAG: hypothetical protein WBW31_19705 [Candidatus Sulfotelmatobacter sp.]